LREERIASQQPAPKIINTGANQTTTGRSVAPEFNAACEINSTPSAAVATQRSRFVVADRNAYSQPATKKAASHIAPPDQSRIARFSWSEVSVLFASFFRSRRGISAESVAITVEGSAVGSPALSATFCAASATGCPTIAIFRAIQGPLMIAKPATRQAIPASRAASFRRVAA
jgi:hypothetical protein